MYLMGTYERQAEQSLAGVAFGAGNPHYKVAHILFFLLGGPSEGDNRTPSQAHNSSVGERFDVS
jgi:hypothetical protein